METLPVAGGRENALQKCTLGPREIRHEDIQIWKESTASMQINGEDKCLPCREQMDHALRNSSSSADFERKLKLETKRDTDTDTDTDMNIVTWTQDGDVDMHTVTGSNDRLEPGGPY